MLKSIKLVVCEFLKGLKKVRIMFFNLCWMLLNWSSAGLKPFNDDSLIYHCGMLWGNCDNCVITIVKSNHKTSVHNFSLLKQNSKNKNIVFSIQLS